eukprot:CAMPEP_0168548590 /NCGR_PEP_ID=MMETSP0413-20121227/4646_1 /TAXON_ID=136452 /ORGANISM="Filamoeba nolandi, Strain NC-AS-23-1" /LENGTH=720 /DNA_ID=CAMNT_0008578911 /DNA_START=24 /DNA_END=2183 /DNA_ORIENTATION=-
MAVSTNNNLGFPVELSISCTELISLNVTSKSGPMVVMYFRTALNKWEEVGRTEILKNTKNPRFETLITVKFILEESQPIRFIIYDVVENAKSLKGWDKIGKVKTTLAKIIRAPKSERSFQILNDEHPNRNNGLLNLKAKFQLIYCNFEASNLAKTNFFRKSAPYFVINRSDDVHGSSFSTTVIKSEVMKNNLNPKWQQVSIPFDKLCNNDPNWPLMVQVWDWHSCGNHELIGQFITNLNKLKSKTEFELIEPIKANKGVKYKNSGSFKLASFSEYELPSFLDYKTIPTSPVIWSGLRCYTEGTSDDTIPPIREKLSGEKCTEISFMVGIDYTGSNGNLSLHYTNPQGANQYAMATGTLADIVTPFFDENWRIPACGLATTSSSGAARDTSNFINKRLECLGIDGNPPLHRNSMAYLSDGPWQSNLLSCAYDPAILVEFSLLEHEEKSLGKRKVSRILDWNQFSSLITEGKLRLKEIPTREDCFAIYNEVQNFAMLVTSVDTDCCKLWVYSPDGGAPLVTEQRSFFKTLHLDNRQIQVCVFASLKIARNRPGMDTRHFHLMADLLYRGKTQYQTAICEFRIWSHSDPSAKIAYPVEGSLLEGCWKYFAGLRAKQFNGSIEEVIQCGSVNAYPSPILPQAKDRLVLEGEFPEEEEEIHKKLKTFHESQYSIADELGLDSQNVGAVDDQPCQRNNTDLQIIYHTADTILLDGDKIDQSTKDFV